MPRSNLVFLPQTLGRGSKVDGFGIFKTARKGGNFGGFVLRQCSTPIAAITEFVKASLLFGVGIEKIVLLKRLVESPRFLRWWEQMRQTYFVPDTMQLRVEAAKRRQRIAPTLPTRKHIQNSKCSGYNKHMISRSSAVQTLLFATVTACLGVVPLPARAQTAAPPAPAATLDRATPESCVQGFVTAYVRGDASAMASYVEGATASDAGAATLRSIRPNYPSDYRIALVGARTTTVAADEVLLYYAPQANTLAMTDQAFANFSQGIILVRRGPDGWKIVTPERSEITGKTKETLKDNLVRCLATLVRYPDLVAVEKQDAAFTTSVSNVRQIALGFMMLVQDNDEVFKVDPANYRKAVLPYIKNPKLFTAPLDSDGTISYRFNQSLASKSLASFAAPPETVLLYEGSWGKPLFRYDGRALIGFADGHVKLVTPQEAKNLRWKP